MPTKKARSREIYQIKVTLAGSKPAIWRRLLVSDVTLGRLHDYLQAAMGWTDSHLHEFRIGDRSYGMPDPDLGHMAPSEINEKTVRVSEVLGGVGSKATYVYDFGDDWEHNLLVEKIVQEETGQIYPACVAGKRRCPPEDCGGVGGFRSYLNILKNPKHADHEETKNWLGPDFDPEDFSPELANEWLSPFQKRAK